MYKLIAYYGDEVQKLYYNDKAAAYKAAHTISKLLNTDKIYILKTDHVHNTKAL